MFPISVIINLPQIVHYIIFFIKYIQPIICCQLLKKVLKMRGLTVYRLIFYSQGDKRRDGWGEVNCWRWDETNELCRRGKANGLEYSAVSKYLFNVYYISCIIPGAEGSKPNNISIPKMLIIQLEKQTSKLTITQKKVIGFHLINFH